MWVAVTYAVAQYPFSVHLHSLFSRWQASVKLDINSHLWRDGMIVARARGYFVQCLAVKVGRLRAVDFVARGEEGSQSECLSLLNDVTEERTDVVDNHSPGADYKMGYLSRKHLIS
jgi:hypothetical protein